jgi:hypothetical protein
MPQFYGETLLANPSDGRFRPDVATSGFFHIYSSTYHLALAPVTHTWMVPVGTINLFVGFACAT